MNSKEYLEKMTNIQKNLLEFIDDENDENSSDTEEKFKNFKDLLTKLKIQDDQHEFKSFLYLLVNISNNHHRTNNFFSKIERILELFKDDFRKHFSNSEVFLIFKNNKRILLFLIEKKIINFDKFIVKQITRSKYLHRKYPQYFQPEIQPFLKEKWFPKYDEIKEESSWILEIQEDLPEDFYSNRKIGENEDYICSLIRKDSLDDFISYIKDKNFELNYIINPSIYETNNFLFGEKDDISHKERKITLIEYMAFFGSIQIFKYLQLNKVKSTPSLWLYAIHSNNPQMIHLLEEKQIEQLEKEFYEEMLKESIKCHHVDFSYYIENNYLENEKKIFSHYEEIIYSLKYYNFIFIPDDEIKGITFNYLCGYDYYILVSFLLKTKKMDVNFMILKNMFLNDI